VERRLRGQTAIKHVGEESRSNRGIRTGRNAAVILTGHSTRNVNKIRRMTPFRLYSIFSKGVVVDRIRFLDQSVCYFLAGSWPTLKKALLALIAVVMAPILLASLVAFASGDWRSVGETEAGDQVSVSTVRILKNNQRMAWVRVEYKEPAKLPQGGPFVELRARVRFGCASGSATPTAEWFYSRDHSGKFVVSKKTRRDDAFGSTPEGGFGGMVGQYVCQQK
jgi:hypothetical protein